MKDEEAGRREVLSLIGDIDYALFTTRSSDDASLHARPMAHRKAEDDGVLWFFTKRDSRKVRDIDADERVLLNFADPRKNQFVSIAGRAKIVTERARVSALWSEMFRPWFPGGADDESVVLVRVEADEAEYWDTPSGVMVNAFGYVRAVATGKPFLAGDVGHVEDM